MKTDSGIVVEPWRNADDLTPVRRFWYDIYVTEMGRHVDTADHERRELDDSRAEAGEIIVARKSGQIIGTLICTPSWTGALGEYESLYEMRRLGPAHPASSAIITKLMVAPEYRHTSLSLRIACELYRHAVPRGVHHPIIDCNEHLVPMFHRLGFTKWGAGLNHPEYGRVTVLKLDCLDLEHLEAVRSPLLPIARLIAPQLREANEYCLPKGATA